MRKAVVVNGKSYSPAEMNFNNVCRMEELGAPITSHKELTLSTVRAYFAICAGIGLDEAGAEIEAHMVGGGELKEISEAYAEAIEESDFFQALKKNAEAETSKETKKK